MLVCVWGVAVTGKESGSGSEMTVEQRLVRTNEWKVQ